MLIKIISINNSPPNWVNDSIKSYVKQLMADIKIEFIEIKPNQLAHANKKKTKEAQEIEKHTSGFHIIALDETGQSFTSVDFSERIKRTLENFPNIAFIIGGADGLDPVLIQKANFVLSLSAMTLPHHFAKVILIEQIYRAFSILKNHPYHRE